MQALAPGSFLAEPDAQADAAKWTGQAVTAAASPAPVATTKLNAFDACRSDPAFCRHHRVANHHRHRRAPGKSAGCDGRDRYVFHGAWLAESFSRNAAKLTGKGRARGSHHRAVGRKFRARDHGAEPLLHLSSRAPQNKRGRHAPRLPTHEARHPFSQFHLPRASRHVRRRSSLQPRRPRMRAAAKP